MINLQVGDCWLWSRIFQIQRYYLVVFVPQVYCTLIPLYSVVLCLASSFADPWYWVNRSIFPWYFPYKRKALQYSCVGYGIVLYHCKQSLRLCERDFESVKRNYSGFLVGYIPSSLWMVRKGLAISKWT